MSSKKPGKNKKLQELLDGLRDNAITDGNNRIELFKKTGGNHRIEVFRKPSYDEEINLSDPVGKKEQMVYDDAWQEGYDIAWDEANKLILRLVKQLS